MNQNFFHRLLDWPKPYLSGTNLMALLDKTEHSRQGVVKRAVQKGVLIRLRRDLYIIRSKLPVDSFELAPILYGPSYVSLESALQYHGWIPEAILVTTCITTKRSRQFETPIGLFLYKHIPLAAFHMGVNQIHQNHSILFIADPWKAIGDMIYVQNRAWKTYKALLDDMRIEEDKIADFSVLQFLAKNYPSQKVKKELQHLYDTRHC